MWDPVRVYVLINCLVLLKLPASRIRSWSSQEDKETCSRVSSQRGPATRERCGWPHARERDQILRVLRVHHHWFLKNLDQTLDPTFAVFEASRAEVANVQGYRAFKLIATFLKDNHFSGMN